jgi:Ca2+-transporting ATPase
LTFTTLIVANVGLILTNRSWSRTTLVSLRTPNPVLWWVVGGVTAFLACVLYFPFLRDLFHFSVLHPDDLLLCLAGRGKHPLVRGPQTGPEQAVSPYPC